MPNPLAGKPLRYLIGADGTPMAEAGCVTEVPFDAGYPATVQHGGSPAEPAVAIAYCNLLDERESYDPIHNRGEYGPYLTQSDTAEQYGEGVIDPAGKGWVNNLAEQFERRKRHGFVYIELDNPDAYAVSDVLGAIHLAAGYGLCVVAKNPLELDGDPLPYVAECCAAIVERGCGSPADMDALRSKAGKPDLPVWFVAFGAGRAWAENIVRLCAPYRNMGVSYSPRGEYVTSVDLLLVRS